MSNEGKYDDMPLTQVMKEWMDAEEWDDEIELSEDRTRSRVSTSFSVNDQSHRTFIEVTEKGETLSVFMYSPFNVPPARMSEMGRILNRINMRLRLGRLGCHDDDDANPVQFLARIDVEGGTLAPGQIGTLVGSAIGTFKQYGQLLAVAALTSQPGDELWQNFLVEEAAEEAEQAKAAAENGPTEL